MSNFGNDGVRHWCRVYKSSKGRHTYRWRATWINTARQMVVDEYKKSYAGQAGNDGIVEETGQDEDATDDPLDAELSGEQAGEGHPGMANEVCTISPPLPTTRHGVG